MVVFENDYLPHEPLYFVFVIIYLLFAKLFNYKKIYICIEKNLFVKATLDTYIA